MILRFFSRCVLATCLLVLPDFVTAQELLPSNTSRLASFITEVKANAYNAIHSAKHEIYIPVNTWHNRLAYSDEKIDKYNEKPWGGGFGNYYYDSDGNWHAVYAMAFMDSNNHVQPIAGYGYQKMVRPKDFPSWQFGYGYTLSITTRQEYSYIPIPLPLPLASIEYKQVSLQSTYILGTRNNGNVLFTWLRWKI